MPELRVIANRPAPEEEAAAPHRLYGFRPLREPYSAALWLADVREALAEAARQGWLPVIVGGTGLYFKALTEGLSDIPEIPPEVRERWRAAARTEPAEALHAELARRDSATAARLRPSDTQRLVRALEVLDATGRPLAEWQGNRQPPLLPLAQVYPLALDAGARGAVPPLRCALRRDAGGRRARTEARAMAALGLDPSLPAMRAVGLPPLLAHLRGEVSLEEATAAAKTATRNYAKRQLTWMRGNFNAWNMHYCAIYGKNKRRYLSSCSKSA